MSKSNTSLTKQSVSLPARVAADRVIAKLREAEKALQYAVTVQQAKIVTDAVAAQEVFAHRQRLGDDVLGYAHQIKTYALARLGELLSVMPKATGTAGVGRPALGGSKREPPKSTATYAELGIDKKTASVAQQLAALPLPVRDAIASRELTMRDALKPVRQEERMVKLAEVAKGNVELALPAKYPIVYADPPWKYEHVKTDNRAIENQYPTMEIEDICKLAVSQVCTDDCVLFLWATSPKLAEAMGVVDAWGFNYRTSMVWVKDQIGMGYYARQQHELLLIATKGEPPAPAPADRPASVINAPRTKHSAKPEQFYEAIERMYPLLPRIELFARSARSGWAAWGNQAVAS